MAKRMLIDATHPEETRVAVVSGSRLDEFDFETSTKKQLKGNIYLAKVTRVEPSLQAAFVDYGGNRHGFLAFSEIHPDYYRVPVSDREFRGDDADEGGEDRDDAEMGRKSDSRNDGKDKKKSTRGRGGRRRKSKNSDGNGLDHAAATRTDARAVGPTGTGDDIGEDDKALPDDADEIEELAGADDVGNDDSDPDDLVDTAEDEEIEDLRRRNKSMSRRYRIQEVISRRQILLVQVAKEERGNKGAALTTFISLAGRYCVLMPNTPRGGGISRKITNPADRKRLKSILEDLKIPEGMAVIVRTAGMERTKAEVKRDYEYLLKLWDDIRERTLNSTAPALINEEANLIRRSIRDLYSKEISEILVEGEEGYKTAKNFMKMLVPSHAKRVQPYIGDGIPLLHRYQVEPQIDNIHNPVVQLKSGGYIVLNSTEALVAIDVNSGRSTRERNIEETAFRTNLEAADEVARQLRLRDLAGLIVIDFIDMEDYRNRSNVEKRLKEAMRSDRARIQLGRISAFGLLEMSRQRLRPSLIEASMETCPSCNGVGFVRSVESTALHVLRAIEEEGMRRRNRQITVSVPTRVALYVLNQKRTMLTDIERRNEIEVHLNNDDTLVPPDYRLERGLGDARRSVEDPDKDSPANRRRRRRRPRPESEADGVAADDLAPAEAAEVPARDDTVTREDEDGGRPRKSRRRGRRGGRRRRDRARPDEVVATDGDGVAADPADSGEAAARTDTDGETAETQPKGRTRAHRAKSTSDASADQAKPTDEKSDRPAPKKRTRRRKADIAEEPEPNASPAATRGRRSRKTPAKDGDVVPVTPEANGSAKEPDSEVVATPARKTRRKVATAKDEAPKDERPKKRSTPARTKKADAPTSSRSPKRPESVTPAPVAAPAAAPEPAAPAEAKPEPPAPSGGDKDAESGERRTGWWQRLVE